MNLAQATDYVKASACALALPLDEARTQRVAAHLLIASNLAGLLHEVALETADELAEIYRPAPFPANDPDATS